MAFSFFVFVHSAFFYEITRFPIFELKCKKTFRGFSFIRNVHIFRLILKPKLIRQKRILFYVKKKYLLLRILIMHEISNPHLVSDLRLVSSTITNHNHHQTCPPTDDTIFDSVRSYLWFVANPHDVEQQKHYRMNFIAKSAKKV